MKLVRLRRLLCTFAVAGFAVAACAHTGGPEQPLGEAVRSYNEAVRWKRFGQASLYLPPTAQAAFLARYTARENDLQVDTVEIQAVIPLPDQEVPTYDVTVIVQANILPSTVLQRLVLVQRWQQDGRQWRLVRSDKELVPETTPPPPTATP